MEALPIVTPASHGRGQRPCESKSPLPKCSIALTRLVLRHTVFAEARPMLCLVFVGGDELLGDEVALCTHASAVGSASSFFHA